MDCDTEPNAPKNGKPIDWKVHEEPVKCIEDIQKKLTALTKQKREEKHGKLITELANKKENHKNITYFEHSWMFRGQSDSSWPLKTSLERCVEKAEKSLTKAPYIEMNLAREFRRRLHHYQMVVPDPDDFIEWFAMMAHYGVPTRFLDCTYSLHMAFFFALEVMDPERHGPAIWAIDQEWLGDRNAQQLPPGTFKGEGGKNTFRGEEGRKVFREQCIYLGNKSAEKPIPLALDVNPLRLNERLSIQQGVFLCPSRLDKSFEQNLLGTAGDDSANLKNNVIKFVTPYEIDEKDEEDRKKAKIEELRKFQKDQLLELHRMNITDASLFPGLDGFCHSLQARILFDVLLKNEVDARNYEKEDTQSRCIVPGPRQLPEMLKQ